MSQKRPGDVDKRIGQRIRAFRLIKGFSQERLSELIGVTFQQLQKYENGTNRISASRLLLISEAMDIRLGVLVESNTDDGSQSSVLEALLNTPDVVRLMKAFGLIESPVARRTLVDMAEILADVNVTSSPSQTARP